MRQTNESNWNMIEIVNSDPMLSEFKYHFYLRNCFIPRHMKIKEIA